MQISNRKSLIFLDKGELFPFHNLKLPIYFIDLFSGGSLMEKPSKWADLVLNGLSPIPLGYHPFEKTIAQEIVILVSLFYRGITKV